MPVQQMSVPTVVYDRYDPPDIRTEQENAMKAMESRVAEIALDAASKIMGEKNSSQQDLSLYDQFIKEAGDSNDGNKH